jgi:hypothetical protein
MGFHSIRSCFLSTLLCCLCGNLPAQQWLTVREGNTSSPYYTFKTTAHALIDISTYGFERGQSYAFLPQGVSTSHPFMIGEHSGDLDSSLISVVGGGTPIPLTDSTSNLQITIPSNYSGDLVYFSTANTSVHYHLKIVDPPGGSYQSPSGTYQPVYDLNSSHISSLAVQVTNSLPGKYAFFNHNNNGSSEIRFNYMHVSNNQWQDASLGYYVAKPDQFPTIPHIYDHLHSINLSPVNGYKPAGIVYQSSGGGNQSGGGGNNTPQYETQSTLMVDQSTSNTGIPYPGSGATWYQSFTAVNPSKLQKFAFVTNGAFTASATVKIREGEGVTGNVLHTGTWTGIGSNTNTYNEYVIDNDVVLTQGQKYTIQLENQTAGSYLGSNSNQYAGGKFHHSGYGGEYGDLKMKIWVLLQAQSAGGTIAITAPGNGSNADPDTDLTVTIQYASGGGGSQTPTWAYRIDSGFPGYGSPHGGTQVSGVTSVNNFLNGQANGNRQVNVALLDQAGNLHNPPIVQSLSVNYQSSGGGNQSGGGGNNTPQYETQSTLMVDQSTSNTGIPYPGSGATWYQSFTAVNPSKLQKFAFVTNGAFTASATVKIREGEGVTGNVLHTGTWTGIGSNTNTYNEYVIDNDVVLTQGQKYTIQLENQTAGSYLGFNSNQYAGGKFHHSGYGGEYGDLKMKIWVLLQAQSTGGTIAITSPSNGSNADPDTDLTVTIQYASGGGGSQTPTWAYRIDSGFPGYGSPHGGTQVSGVTSVNNFLNGQANGNRQVNVALLDQAGNLHNPPVVQTISVSYQSASGGYQTGGNGYQSGGGDTIVITAPGNGSNADTTTDLTVTIQYASGGGGYQTPTWAYRIDSGFPGYGSPHGGTQVTGVTTANDFLSGQANGVRQVKVALLDQAGNLHNPPIVQTLSLNYQSGSGGYQTGGNGYQTGGGDTILITAPGNGSNADATTDLTVTIQYASGGGGYQTPTWAYRIDSGFPGYGSPHGGTQVTGVTTANDFLSGQANGVRQVKVALLDQAGNLHNPPIVQTLSVNYQSSVSGYQTPNNGYQTPSNGYQTPGTGYQTPSHGYQTPGTGTAYQTPSHGYQTPGTDYQTPGDGYDPIPSANEISQVKTLGHQVLNSSILLTGELLDLSTSNMHPIEVGFLVSSSMQISPNDPLIQKISAEKNPSGSFSTNFVPTSNQVLYFKAYAESRGQINFGNIRKIEANNLNAQNQTSYQEALSILAVDSIQEGGGWIRNPWFGRYKAFNNGWIYHFTHGWLYPASDNFNGIWAWSETRAWIWFNKQVYPFMYQSNIGNWIYLLPNKNGEARYLNYSTNLIEGLLP